MMDEFRHLIERASPAEALALAAMLAGALWVTIVWALCVLVRLCVG